MLDSQIKNKLENIRYEIISKLKLADRKKIKSITGYDVGTIPLVGLELPCLFDKKLL